MRLSLILLLFASTACEVTVGTSAGVLERAQSERLLFLELLHMLAESSTICDLLIGAMAAAPDTTHPQEDLAGSQPAQEPQR